MSDHNLAVVASVAGAFGSLVGVFALIAYFWQAKIMRGSLQVTQDAAVEAVRARLDEVAPTVSLDAAAPEWEPWAPGYGTVPVGKWPKGQLFEFPEKQGERIILQQVFEIANHGSQRVEFRFEGDLLLHTQVGDQAELRRVDSLLTPPGGANGGYKIYLQRAFTIAEMAENYRARQALQPLPHRATGTIAVHDDRDNGVTDKWTLELTGCPVQPHPSRDAVWVIVPYHLTEGDGLRSLEYTLLPNRERIHWISRKAGRQLPQPRLGAKKRRFRL